MNITEEFDFQKRIADIIGLPVVVENDANACAWGELAVHRGGSVHDFLYVLVEIRPSNTGNYSYGGIGVGIGIVINGTLYPGSRFTAGEFRSVFWDGENSGQFSLSEEEAELVTRDRKTRKKLFRELAKNITLIVHVMNLDHLFIGGDILDYQDEFTPILNEELGLSWPYPTEVMCEIQYASFGSKTVVAGAAAMILDRFFSDQIFPLGDVRNRHERKRVFNQISEHGFGLDSVTGP